MSAGGLPADPLYRELAGEPLPAQRSGARTLFGQPHQGAPGGMPEGEVLFDLIG